MKRHILSYFKIILFLFYGINFSQTYHLTGSLYMDTTGWTMKGDEINTQHYFSVALTNYSRDNKSSSIMLNEPINLNLCKKWTVEFEFFINSNANLADNNGDGFAFWILKDPPNGFNNSSGLGIPPVAEGLMFGFDTYNNTSTAINRKMSKIHVVYGKNHNENDTKNIETNNNPNSTYHSTDLGSNYFRGNNFKKVIITYEKITGKPKDLKINLSIDGRPTINNLILTADSNVETMEKGYLGFSASTRADWVSDNHRIKNVKIYSEQSQLITNNITENKCSTDLNGLAEVNLKSYENRFITDHTNYNFEYFDITNSINITNPEKFYFNKNTNVRVRILDKQGLFCDSNSADANIFLNYQKINTNNFTLKSCKNTNGIATFDLEKANVSSETNIEKQYFQTINDLELNRRPILNINNFQANRFTEIFVSIKNINTGCTAISKIFLDFNPDFKTNNAILKACRNIKNQNQGTFNLNNANISTERNLIKKYYLTENDLQNKIEIINPNSFDSNERTIFVKSINQNGCESISEIRLELENRLDFRNAEINVCENPNGKGTFNLTLANVTSNQNLKKEYFETIQNLDRNVAILNPRTFESERKTIYVKLTDESKQCSAIAEVQLELNELPEIRNDKIFSCEHILGSKEGVFDLNNADVTSELNTQKKYYKTRQDLINNQNEIIEINNYISINSTVFVKVINQNNCFSVAEIYLEVYDLKLIDTTLRACTKDNIIAIFNLDLANISLDPNQNLIKEYFLDEEDIRYNNPIINYNLFESEKRTIYVKSTNDNGCIGISRIYLDFNPNFKTIDTSLKACRNIKNQSLGTFNLDNANISSEINLIKTYFLTENDLENGREILNPNSFDSNERTILVKTINKDGCDFISKIRLELEDRLDVKNDKLEICSTNSGRGIFDLTLANVTSNQNLKKEYFETIQDLDRNNPINTPFIYNSSEKTVYVKLTDESKQCSAIAEIQLRFIENPRNQNTTIFSCKDKTEKGIYNLKTAIPSSDPKIQKIYYSRFNDYLNDRSRIPENQLENYISEKRTIYVRVIYPNNCIGLEIIMLEFYDIELKKAELYSCQNIEGNSVFDLNLAEITSKNNVIKEFYENPNLTPESKINNPNEYSSNEKKIYVKIIDENLCEYTTEIELKIHPYILAKQWKAEGTLFIKEEIIIHNGIYYQVITTHKANDSTHIPSIVPALYRPITITLIDDIIACREPDGTGIFDLTSAKLSFQDLNYVYYKSEQDRINNIPITEDPEKYKSFAGKVYVKAINEETLCEADLEINLNLYNEIILTNADLFACINPQGKGVFDLTSARIATNQTLTYEYYISENDLNLNNKINNPRNYESIPGKIIVKAINFNGCYNITEINLNLYDEIILTKADLFACANPQGTGIFDLTSANISNQTFNNIRYYESEQNLQNNIEIPRNNVSSYVSNKKTIFVKVTDQNNCFKITEINLNLYDLPILTRADLFSCVNPQGTGTFDLTKANISNQTFNNIKYFDSRNIEIPRNRIEAYISNEQTIYAEIIDENNCISKIEIKLNLYDEFNLIKTDLFACKNEQGKGIFDLTSVNISNENIKNIKYFDSENNEIDQNQLEFYISEGEIIKVEAENENGCFAKTEIKLNLYEDSNLIKSELFVCRDEEGKGIFNLKEAEIDPSKIKKIEYYNKENNALIHFPQGYRTYQTIVYAKVIDQNNCETITDINLNLYDEIILTEADLFACANPQGKGIFDLTSANISNQTFNNIRYYESEQNLQNNIEIPRNNVSSYVSNKKTIFVKVTDQNNCFKITEINLNLYDLPILTRADLFSCVNPQGTGTFDLTKANISNQTFNNIKYFDSRNIEIPRNRIEAYISNEQIISVEIIDQNNCLHKTEINLNLYEEFNLIKTDLFACTNEQGTGIFDLTSANISNEKLNNIRYFDLENNEINKNQAAFYTSKKRIINVVAENENGCFATTEINLNLYEKTNLIKSELFECKDEEGLGIFNLKEAEIDPSKIKKIEYYNKENNAFISFPQGYRTYQTIVYAKVIDQNNCETITDINLNLYDKIELEKAELFSCTNEFGLGIFDLTSANIYNQKLENIKYYSSRENLINNNEIDENLVKFYESQNQVVYAKIEDENGCSIIAEIKLNLYEEIKLNPAVVFACKDRNFNGVFDLTSVRLSDNQNLVYEYYSTIEDLRNQTNELSINYDITKYHSNLKVIYVIAKDKNNNCTRNAQINLDFYIDSEFIFKDIITCKESDGNGIFNLTSANISNENFKEIKFYESEQNLENDIQIENINDFRSQEKTIYVKIINSNNCEYKTHFRITLYDELDLKEANLFECEDSEGKAIFDLTKANISLENVEKKYYESEQDIQNEREIPVPERYRSDSKVIFVKATNSNCQAVIKINLNLYPRLILNPAQVSTCKNENGKGIFNLSSANIPDENIANIIYYESLADLENNNSINDSSNYESHENVIFAKVITLDGCQAITTVSLRLYEEFKLNKAEILTCKESDGTGIFDLTSADISNENINIEYYTTTEDLENQTNRIRNINTYKSGEKIIFVRATNQNNCISKTEIKLKLYEDSKLNNAELISCELKDGKGNFNLTSANISNETFKEIKFYESIQNLENNIQIENPNDFHSQEKTIYVKVINSNNCTYITEIKLNLYEKPNLQKPEIWQCADNNNQGIFDLKSVKISDETFKEILYFPTQEDLTNGTNQIIYDLNTYKSTKKTIYVKVIDFNLCENQTEIELKLYENISLKIGEVFACKVEENRAYFDLTKASLSEDTIQKIQYFYTYENLMNNINEITELKNFFYSNDIIYALITNSNSCKGITEIHLKFYDDFKIENKELYSCKDNLGKGTFNLNDVYNSTENLNFKFYESQQDLDNGIEILNKQLFSSEPKTIYVVAENQNNCKSQAEINLKVHSDILINNANIFECKNLQGIATFDLTSAELSNEILKYYYYDNIIDFNRETNPISEFDSKNYKSSTQKRIYVRAENDFGCKTSTFINLNIYNNVELIKSDIFACKEQDGTGIFDLNSIRNSNPNLTDIKFYESEQNLENNIEIENITEYKSSEKIIYIKAKNNNNCDYKNQINLVLNDKPILRKSEILTCEIEHQQGIFNLKSVILSNNNNLDYKYYDSYQDLLEDKPIINPETYESSEKIIHVKATNSNNCSEFTTINLRFYNLDANINNETEKFICIDSSTTLQADSGFISYLWSTGQTTKDISNAKIGDYWVDLTSRNGCIYRKYIYLKAFTDFNINVVNVNDSRVTVRVTGGTQPFKYSLDGIIWQNSNIFENVSRGSKVVYVKDANECSIKKEYFNVVKIANLITPNKDGINDVVDYSFLMQYENLEFYIYNRYGEQIFKGTPNNNFTWDGKDVNNRSLSSTNYWYTLKWKDPNTKKMIVYNSWLMLKN